MTRPSAKRELKHINVPLEIKEDKALEKGQFKGLGSTFGNVDFGGDRIEKGAFADTMAEWKQNGALPYMPWYHDMRVLVGDWLEVRETDQGLEMLGQVWVDEKSTESSKMVHNMLTGTGAKELSIGFSIVDSESVKENGENVRIIKQIDLYEVSVVPFGMNPKAQISDAKSLLNGEGVPDIRAIENILKQGGLSAAHAKALIAKGYGAIERDANDSDSERDAAMTKALAPFHDILNSMKGP